MRFVALALLALIALMALPAVGQGVVFNEILTSGGLFTDEDGEHPDWLELYNAGVAAVDLQGYGVSDDPDEPFRWVFPSRTIEPGGFLLVLCSGKDRKTGPYLHTNFSLKSAGEPLTLRSPDGQLVAQFDAVAVPRDQSFGRQPDGSDTTLFFDLPTPGASNTSPGHSETLNPPVFSHLGGFYANAFQISVVGPSGAEVRYTTDGSVPTESSPRLTSLLPITSRAGDPDVISLIPTNDQISYPAWEPPSAPGFKATVIRARAFQEGRQPSRTITQTYFVGPGVATRYPVPIVSIATDADNLFGFDRGIYVPGVNHVEGDPWTGNYAQSGSDWERPASFELFESGVGRAYADNIGIRIHGGWSTTFPQKSLRLYSGLEYGNDMISYQLIPGNSVSQYKRMLLRNSGNDWMRALMRDYVVQSLVEATTFDLQAARTAVVFINGEYWGIQRFRERYDKYYISTHHGVSPDNIDFLEYMGSIEEGTNKGYLDLIKFVKLNDLAVPANYDQVCSQIELDGLVEYVVTELYCRNSDWPANNIKFWRRADPPGKWRWMLYDTDSGFSWTGGEDSWKQDMLSFVTMTGGSAGNNTDAATLLIRSLMRNAQFRNLLLSRIADRLNSTFTTPRVLQHIESARAELEPLLPEHIQRWGFPASMEAWSAEVQKLRDFATSRPASLRTHCTEFFGLGGTSNISLDAQPREGGSVSVGVVPVQGAGFPWTGVYFQDVPVTISALAAPGFRFVGWQGNPSTSPALTIVPHSDLSLVAVFEPEGGAN